MLLGQPGDPVTDWATQLADTYEQARRLQQYAGPSLELMPCEAHHQIPDWSTLHAHDLVVLVESSNPAAVDWRNILTSANQGFQVIYPSPHASVQELQWTLGHHLQRTHGESPWPLRAEIASRWQGACEKCSDPECEHQLFRRLLTQRRTNSSPL